MKTQNTIEFEFMQRIAQKRDRQAFDEISHYTHMTQQIQMEKTIR